MTFNKALIALAMVAALAACSNQKQADEAAADAAAASTEAAAAATDAAASGDAAAADAAQAAADTAAQAADAAAASAYATAAACTTWPPMAKTPTTASIRPMWPKPCDLSFVICPLVFMYDVVVNMMA